MALSFRFSSMAGLLFLFIFLISEKALGQKTVPKSVYVFGDSLADVGNNDRLFTRIRADFPHNGVDFAGSKPTGRFCNGKNAVDFLAENIGLPSPPPYLSIASIPTNLKAFLNGVNFASGGAGILDGTHQGECLSFNKQIEYFTTVYKSIVEHTGVLQTKLYLSNSIFVFIIGSNDLLIYLGDSKVTPQQFIDTLIAALKLQLEKMYELAARKFVFIGTSALGCCPALRHQNKSGDCNVMANYVSDLFNEAVSSLLQNMKSQFNDMNYSFFDTCLALLELIKSPQDYGFSEVKAACCGLGSLNAKVACTPISHLCSNRANHVFWDLYHPTQAVDAIIASNAVDGLPPLVYPMNVRQLIAS